MDLQVRLDERPHQPRPDRPLVIGRRIRIVSALIGGVVRRERPQADRRQQFDADDLDNRPPPGRRQQAVRACDGKYLIGANGCVFAVGVDAIVEASGVFVPECLLEGLRGAIGQGRPEQHPVMPVRPLGGYPQRLVPEGVDFNALAPSRRNGPAGNLRIHPRQLRLGVPARQQTVGARADAESSPTAICLEYLLDSAGQSGPPGGLVAGGADVTIGGDDEPQRRVDAVEARPAATLVETVGNHPFINGLGECRQNAEGGFILPRLQRQARQGDHGVPAPVGEPMITGEDGIARPDAQIAPRDDEDVDGGGKSSGGLVGGISDGLDDPHQPAALPFNSGDEIDLFCSSQGGSQLHRSAGSQTGLKPARSVKVFEAGLSAGNVGAVAKTIPPLWVGMKLPRHGHDWAGGTDDGNAHRAGVGLGVLDVDTVGIVKVGHLLRIVGPAETVIVPQRYEGPDVQHPAGTGNQRPANSHGVGGFSKDDLFQHLCLAAAINERRSEVVAELDKVRPPIGRK